METPQESSTKTEIASEHYHVDSFEDTNSSYGSTFLSGLRSQVSCENESGTFEYPSVSMRETQFSEPETNFMDLRARAEAEAKAHAKEVFNRYSTPCHVGNWYEQMCALEATQAAKSELYKQGRTSGQRAEAALGYLNEPIVIPPGTDPNVAKSLIQIVSKFEHSLVTRFPKQNLTVSATMTEEQLIDGQVREINHKSDVGLSRFLNPARRNTFCFLRADPSYAHSRILRYNIPYYIRLLATAPKTLFLRCEPRSFATVGLYGGDLPITISDKPDPYCLFYVGPVKESDATPAFTNGFQNMFGQYMAPNGPVKTGTAVTIVHCMSRYFLTISSKLVLTTYLGEAEIHAACGRKTGKTTPREHQWILKTQDSSDRVLCLMSAGDEILD